MAFRGFCLFFLAVLALSFEPWLLKSEKLTCNSVDLGALIGFYNCVDSEIFGSGWNKTASPDCCSWTGVICDSSTVSGTRVVGLELGSKRLTGKICGSLAELYHLRVLNLSDNYLSGSLPAELFKLQNLEVIDVSNNDFTGSINRGMCRTSTGIRVLNFYNNHFSGEVPKDLANCTSLHYLSFAKNSLSGSLPESVFQLQNIRQLYLQDNWISGLLNNGFGNLSNLVKLDISSNMFSGDLPDIFGSLTRLERFSANTNLFTGRLPTSLVNSPSLQMLYLNNNSLSGSINLNCSAMKNLVSLDLGSNLFHGPIPDSLSFCQRLIVLNLARNNLNSELPNDFKNLQALTHLSFSNTRLVNISSTLEILQHCRNLSILVLSLNFYDEEIPDNVNMQFNNLKGLVLGNCKLRGSIPQWLSSCHKLQLLDLSWNHLGGTIPSWFGEFESLFYLDLSNNSFKGEIPKSLTLLQTLISGNISLEEPVSSFQLYTGRQGGQGLRYKQISGFRPTLDLSYNMLQGSIWPGFGNLKRLHVFILKDNNLGCQDWRYWTCLTISYQEKYLFPWLILASCRLSTYHIISCVGKSLKQFSLILSQIQALWETLVSVVHCVLVSLNSLLLIHSERKRRKSLVCRSELEQQQVLFLLSQVASCPDGCFPSRKNERIQQLELDIKGTAGKNCVACATFNSCNRNN